MKKKYSNSLFEGYANLTKGNLDVIKSSQVKFLLRWTSSYVGTLHDAEKINKHFKYNPLKLIKIRLMLLRQQFPTVLKYPKAKLYSDEEFDIVAGILQKLYKWSKREKYLQKAIIINLLEDKEYVNKLALGAGLEDKKRRKLNLKVSNIKKEPIQKIKTVFDY